MTHPAEVDPTQDASRAARRILTDDGFNIGVLFKGDREPYLPRSGNGEDADAIRAMEREFVA
jgi:2-oxoglutarate ferredoxin oxidoreductase subunit beta